MAWTNVRYGRESFDSQALQTFPGTVTALFDGWLTGPEKYLAAFIAIQVLEFALLGQGGGFDPILAICLSASLVLVALMFTKQREITVARTAATGEPAAPFAAPRLSHRARRLLAPSRLTRSVRLGRT